MKSDNDYESLFPADLQPPHEAAVDFEEGLTTLIRRGGVTAAQEDILRSLLGGESQNDVARRLGVCRQRVNQQAAVAVNRLRAALGLEEWLPEKDCRLNLFFPNRKRRKNRGEKGRKPRVDRDGEH